MPNNKDYAIVIGIKDYTFLKPLQGPIQDAEDFEEWLFSSGGGDLPNHKKDPTVLRHVFFISFAGDPLRPIQDDIDDCLFAIKKNGATTGFRRFYFFFAGHGLGVNWHQNALCLPKWSNDYLNAALSSAEYLDFIVNSGYFEEVFFFLDCCRDRKIGARPLHPQLGWPKPGDDVANCSSLVVYGSRFDNPSYEAMHLQEQEIVINGYLSRALVAGLRGAASNPGGDITIHSLKSFLKSKVEELAKADNRTQTVQFEDRFSPETVIFRGFPNNLIQVSITFAGGGRFRLEDPDLREIRAEDNPAASWSLKLKKGIYTLTEKTSGAIQFIRIDGTINPFTYAVN